jgi:hypothetical protein
MIGAGVIDPTTGRFDLDVWADRLREEVVQLDCEIEQFDNWRCKIMACKDLSTEHQALMSQQLDALNTYKDILSRRIVVIGKKESK